MNKSRGGEGENEPLQLGYQIGTHMTRSNSADAPDAPGLSNSLALYRYVVVSLCPFIYLFSRSFMQVCKLKHTCSVPVTFSMVFTSNQKHCKEVLHHDEDSVRHRDFSCVRKMFKRSRYHQAKRAANTVAWNHVPHKYI